METKEINIVAPVGYEIDKENSTFDCIKFKKIEQKRWRDTNSHVGGYYLGHCTVIYYPISNLVWKNSNLNLFATEKQAKSALAMAQISQIMANDKRFGGIVTDEEYNQDVDKYCIFRSQGRIVKGCFNYYNVFLAFHTPFQRDLFLQENEDLVKDYLMID